MYGLAVGIVRFGRQDRQPVAVLKSVSNTIWALELLDRPRGPDTRVATFPFTAFHIEVKVLARPRLVETDLDALGLGKVFVLC